MNGYELVDIRILGLSLDAYRTSSQHHDELFREFALIRSRAGGEGHEVPARLLDLIEELSAKYSNFTATPTSQLLDALERGDESIDLTYRVPASVGAACTEFAKLLTEAEEYCRQGELLTLAPPPDAVAFRDWFLGEFVAQVEGSPPTPWPARS